MDLAHFIMRNNDLMNKDKYLVPEQAPLIILNGKLGACMDLNDKDTNYTRHISMRMNLVINGEE